MKKLGKIGRPPTSGCKWKNRFVGMFELKEILEEITGERIEVIRTGSYGIFIDYMR